MVCTVLKLSNVRVAISNPDRGVAYGLCSEGSEWYHRKPERTWEFPVYVLPSPPHHHVLNSWLRSDNNASNSLSYDKAELASNLQPFKIYEWPSIVPNPHIEIQRAAIFSNTQQHFALTLESKTNHRKLQFLFRGEGGQQRHQRIQENILRSKHDTTHRLTTDLKRWLKMAHTLKTSNTKYVQFGMSSFYNTRS